MRERVLLSGNEALGEGAIRAGCRFFFGYPITPQGELFDYLARRLPEVGGAFLQSESEISAINMVYGAAAAGKRVMTASSSTGVSLMQEGISFLATTQLPCLIVNIMRAGPGLGRVSPSQADYMQATKGGGHGGYHTIVLAPASAQEMTDLGFEAFSLADKYRTPVMILGDGILGQTMEPVILPNSVDMSQLPLKPWAITGARGRERNLVLAAPYTDEELIDLNSELEKKYATIREQEAKWESKFLEDNTDVAVVAFGSSARISEEAILKAREQGLRVGLIRPITLWPFPEQAFADLENVRTFLVVEMNNGQMLEDVRLAAHSSAEVYHFGQGGGWIPSSQDVYRKIVELLEARSIQ